MIESDHPEISGLLPIYKPLGMISKDVSRWLAFRFGKIKLGHVGTLDPAAEGVLPILVGRATRFQDYLLVQKKAYEFDITFGYETDTLDLEGKVVRRGSWDHISQDSITLALESFLGPVVQFPPIYSAVKFKGKALYDYARAGTAESVPLGTLQRNVEIYSIVLRQWNPPVASIFVECSKGTYVRSLMRDIALKLGSYGTLSRLVRTNTAGLSLDMCLHLDDIDHYCQSMVNALDPGVPKASQPKFPMRLLTRYIKPVESLDLGLPRWNVKFEVLEKRLMNGQQATVENADFFEGNCSPVAHEIFLFNASGRALGIAIAKKTDNGRILIQLKRGL